VQLSGVSDGRDVSGPVPSSFYAKILGQNRDLARRRQAARLRQVDANVINQALDNQRLPLVRAIKQLTHGQGSRALLANLAEVGNVLR